MTNTFHQPSETFDLILRNGTVFDGTGSEPYHADIGICGEKIAAIGDLSRAIANRNFDLGGHHIAPGFVDIHTHSDISVTFHPDQKSAIGMGVTTQVVGNCGLSMGMTTPSAVFDFEHRWLAPHGERIRWNSFEEHLKIVMDQGCGTNYVPLGAHGTLRKKWVGLANRPVTNEELLAMQKHLAEVMEAGAWGFSSGLEYPPSGFGDEAELIALCRIVRDYGGLYATHLRNEGDTLVEAVQEAINVAENTQIPLQLSHHKAEGQANWGKVKTTLLLVEAAMARGVDIQMDQYPYTAFMTALAIQILPAWALEGSLEATAETLRDAEKRVRIAEELRARGVFWAENSPKSVWHTIKIGVSHSHPEIQGQSLAALAAQVGVHPIDYVLELLAENEGYLSAVNFGICEEDIALVLRNSTTSIGSDGVGTHPDGRAGADLVHPRAYGTFPRVLARYVREKQILSEAEAIRRMTSLPAERIGLKQRGRIAEGYYADLTVYAPDEILDLATFDEPHRYADGIRLVLVNGTVALEAGIPNTARAGRVLRRGA